MNFITSLLEWLPKHVPELLLIGYPISLKNLIHYVHLSLNVTVPNKTLLLFAI